MTYVGNIDRGQPPRLDPDLNTDEGRREELRGLVHLSDRLTTEDLETIQREVVGGLRKDQSQVLMSDEASEAWDAIAAEVAAGADVNTWELPLEVPGVPTDIRTTE